MSALQSEIEKARVKIHLDFDYVGNGVQKSAPYIGAEIRIWRVDFGEKKSATATDDVLLTTDEQGSVLADFGAKSKYLILLPSLMGDLKWHRVSKDVDWDILTEDEVDPSLLGGLGELLRHASYVVVTTKGKKPGTIRFAVDKARTSLSIQTEVLDAHGHYGPADTVSQASPSRVVAQLNSQLARHTSGRYRCFIDTSDIGDATVDAATQLVEVAADMDVEDMAGQHAAAVRLAFRDGSRVTMQTPFNVRESFQNAPTGTTVNLTRTGTLSEASDTFNLAVKKSIDGLSFDSYMRFMNSVYCGKAGLDTERFKDGVALNKDLLTRRFLPFTDGDAYRVIKVATEAFVMVNCGVHDDFVAEDSAYLARRDIPRPKQRLKDVFNHRYLTHADGVEGKILPYLAVIRAKLPDIPIRKESGISSDQLDECYGILQDKLLNPCLLELIWSYWHEEGMLVQTMNAISRRFQNVRSPARGLDPLANLEIDPLRRLNGEIWGYIQDEQHRLSVIRRNYEYDHHYGLRLEGKAIQNFAPADTRSKFLEAFHQLLRLCTVFYKQDDDTTVKADAFPILNALKEVHLILSQGAHNQFGDLPSTARVEMLMQQWFLARPEFREFLPTRTMVAYPEPWMDRVDAMKKLQGWTDTSVLHFHNLAVFGEQILLAIRWGKWSDVIEPLKAFNFARFHRPQVQGYIHAYRATTGVDLSADPTVENRVDATLPSQLLRKRLASQAGVR